jgi:hypothetical protein
VAHDLIAVSPADAPLDRALLEARGGFVWWYVDLLDASGAGLVMIWSFGLPFLPGYAASARAARAPAAIERPSFNLALYSAGRPRFYLLQEHAREEAEWEGGHFRFGGTTVDVTTAAGALAVRANIDCHLPGGGSLAGSVSVDGPMRAGGIEDGTETPTHRWTPVSAMAHGTASLVDDTGAAFHLEGRAYHDMNGGSAPLHDLGIDWWMWCRVPFLDEERVLYALWPEGGGPPRLLGIGVDAQGRSTRLDDLTVALTDVHHDALGMRRLRRFEVKSGDEVWLAGEVGNALDRGPFYVRAFVDATRADGARATGMWEAVVPARVDLARHRAFVRMRVHHARERGSPFLPLFTGPNTGRFRRFARGLFRGGRVG